VGREPREVAQDDAGTDRNLAFLQETRLAIIFTEMQVLTDLFGVRARSSGEVRRCQGRLACDSQAFQMPSVPQGRL